VLQKLFASSMLQSLLAAKKFVTLVPILFRKPTKESNTVPIVFPTEIWA